MGSNDLSQVPHTARLVQRPGSAVWYAAWYDPALRRERRVSTRTTDRAEAERRLGRAGAANAAATPGGDPRNPTIAEVLDHYWNIHAKDLPSAEQAAITIRHLKAHFKKKRVRCLERARDEQQAYVDARAAGHRKFAGPKRAAAGSAAAKPRASRAGITTINRELSVLRAAIYHFRDRHPAAPAPEIWCLPRTAPRNRWLSREETQRLIAAAGTDHLRLFMLLMLATGARPGAILELRWSQVDLDGRVIHLDPPGRPETGKGRATVPIADGALSAELPRFRQLAETDHVIEYAGAPVCSVKTGFRAALRRADLPPGEITPYTLRHTAATWMAQRGTPM